MIKVICFDIGNVIFKFDIVHALTNLIKLTGLKQSPLELFRFFETSETEHAYCEGRISSEEFYEYVLEVLNIDCSYDEFQKVYCDMFTPIHETIKLIEELKEKGVSVFVLSNTNDLHFEYLQANYPILQSIDVFVLSYKESCQKPQSEIYDILIERAGCEPERIVFVDDLKENVEAARSHGIQAFHFTKPKHFIQELKKLNVL